MYLNIYSFIAFEIRKKKTELNELDELECSKTPSQIRKIKKDAPLYLLTKQIQQVLKTFISQSDFKDF